MTSGGKASVNHWLQQARCAAWLGLAGSLLACSSAPTAGTDGAASAADDVPIFTFSDSTTLDAADAPADAPADVQSGTDAVADSANDAATDAGAGTDAATSDETTAGSDAADATDTTDAGCTPGSCPAADSACAIAICQPDGTCGLTAAADGTSCNDANGCTALDSCQAGSCVGTAINCTDGNDCTIDSCTPANGCVHAFDNSPCEDGDGCTVNDECVSGACTAGAPIVCTASDPCQQVGTCEPATGQCSMGAQPNGTACGTSQVCMVGKCTFADALPAGTLAWFATADCPGGWDAEPLAAGRTLVPGDASTVGQLDGTPLTAGEDRVHSHTVSGSISTSAVSFVGIASCCNAGLCPAGDWAISGSALPASAGIPYVQLRACKKSTAIAYGAAPESLIAFVAGQDCPDSWASAAAGLSRFIVGTPPGGTTGATFGGSWAASHSHSVTADVALSGHGIALASGCCGGGYAAAGTVQFSASSDAGTATFPSMQRVACAASAPAAGVGPIPSGLVGFFNASSCPAGWSVATAAAGRLIVGAVDGNGVGVQVGKPLADQEDRSHSHGVSLSIQPPVKDVAGANGGNTQAADNTASEAIGQSGSAPSGMPFVQWLACQKN